MEEQLKKLELRIQQLEQAKNKKDVWDIISIISSFLIPLSIFVAGYLLSEADRQAQLERQEVEIELAQIKSKVDQAQLVSSFLDALVDENVYKRKLAIKSVLLALPETGAEIVSVISMNDPNQEVQQYATKSLKINEAIQQPEAIQQLYSPRASERMQATTTLSRTAVDESAKVKNILATTLKLMDAKEIDQSALLNTLRILIKSDPEALKKNGSLVKEFITELRSRKLDARTRAYIDALGDRMK
ncbi:hypothetical protein [Croceiramulus getboli]|nr:hypothetical protein P8624_03875 [Flavobacteriaceae bacterium YJPT1-3]